MKSLVHRLQFHKCDTHRQPMSLLCLQFRCSHRSRRFCKQCVWNDYQTNYISVVELGQMLSMELGNLLCEIENMEVTEQGIDRLGDWLSQVIELDDRGKYTFKEGVHLYNESGRFIGLDQLYQNQSMEQLAYEWKQKESIRLDDFVVQVALNLDSSQIMVICEKSIKLFIQWKQHQWTQNKQPWNDIHENVKIVNCDNNLKMMAVQYQNSKIITIWKKESNSENWFKQGQIVGQKVIFIEAQQTILVTGNDFSINVYKFVNGEYELSLNLNKHDNRIIGICLSNDDKMLASTSIDNQIYIWKQNNKQEWQYLMKVFKPGTNVLDVQFNQSSTLLLANFDYKKVRIWQRVQQFWKLLTVVSCPIYSTLCLIFNKHTQMVLSKQNTFNICIWSPTKQNEQLKCQISQSKFVAMNNYQDRLFTCHDKRVVVYGYSSS